ncbi:hypothetical protein [Algoriphagus sp.]|uniref:hypothetical protein n=1 Tax=Algoriphagus sp. TaxID=1872435 RepID=UPI003F70D433
MEQTKSKSKVEIAYSSQDLGAVKIVDIGAKSTSMKTQRGTCFTLVALILFSLFTGCQNVEIPGLKCRVKSVSGPADDVTGKWKLVRVKTFNMENGRANEVDYSCDDIIYNFNEEDTVEITEGEFDFIPDSGTYEYELILSPFDRADGFTMKIGLSSWACFLESGKMTLDGSGLDGEILEFVRIE